MVVGTSDKRERLVEAAAGLVHRRGFHRTSLAEIAAEAGVPLGNVYYYFRTKSALGEALLARYSDGQAALRAAWDAEFDPHGRLEAFIDMALRDREVLTLWGCPLGGLAAELGRESGKGSGELQASVGVLLREWSTWLADTIRALGHGADATGLALHLLAAQQGASLLAHAFGEADAIVGEAEILRRWVRSL